jgi:predicted nucleotidyltransferase
MIMKNKPTYPTVQHEKASEAIVNFYSDQDIDSVLLTCSCARGKATKDSCLDIIVLVSPEKLIRQKEMLEKRWNEFYESEKIFDEINQVGKYSFVDLDFTDGCFEPKSPGWTTGPDNFELEIGNTFVYVIPLLERTDYFQRCKARYLPYYDEELRQKRLEEAKKVCFNNLDHIPLYVDRGLYFQAFNRLYHASQEFMQALFISRRVYPIAYDKWIREQIEDILGMPEIYKKLVSLMEISHFESHEIIDKALALEHLFHEYINY